MSFGVKHYQTITASIINYFSGIKTAITDFTIGSKIRTAFEAVALEIEQVYYQLYIGITGGIKDAIYNTFNFPPLPSRNTTGTVRFSRSTPAGTNYVIPAGTVISTVATEIQGAVSFHTTTAVTLLISTTYIDAPVICQIPGTAGNVAANTITIINTMPTGIETVNNLAAFSTGRDTETEDARKTRFQTYIDNLSRATLPALEYAAGNVNGIIDAIAIETPYVNCFAYDASTAVFTDNSLEANLPSGIPFYAFPNPIEVNDIVYIGGDSRFDSVRFDISLGLVGTTLIWEYWNGSAWVTLGCTDDTNFLASSGLLSFTIPATWKRLILNNTNKFWIRMRVSVNNVSQIPKLFMVTLPPFQGIIYVVAYDGTYSLSIDLKSAVVAACENYRGAGIKVIAKAPLVTFLDITINLRIDSQADADTVKNNIKQKVTDWLAGFTLNRSLILSELVQFVENSDENILETIIVLPIENYITSADEVLKAGTITVNQIV